MMEALTEMSDAIMSCERETVLYQDPKLYSLVEKVYLELLEILNANLKFYATAWIRRGTQINVRTMTKKSIAEVRRLSQAVLREVDYQHRLEMRATSSRIVDMQIEQRQIPATLEDQKRILRSLQEERKIMTVVQEQQKVLQVVQQIQGAIQMGEIGEQVRASP